MLTGLVTAAWPLIGLPSSFPGHRKALPMIVNKLYPISYIEEMQCLEKTFVVTSD